MIRPTTPLPVTGRQLLDLIGGIILLVAAYYAVMARRSTHPAYRQAYGRAVLQYTAVFLVFAYTAFVLWPDSQAWPVQTGEHLWLFFQQLDTVPDHVDTHLTAYYTALLQQIGVVTGTTMYAPGLPGTLEGPLRTLGLVIYTLVFTLISLGAHVPSRILASIHNTVTDDPDAD